MNKILQHWLLFIACAHIAAGFALPFVAYSSGFDFYSERLAATFWNGGPVPPQAESFQRWIVALFGPTVAAWGVSMAVLVRAGARTQARWPWNALLLSLLAWAPADIAISLLHGFWPHVVLDIGVVIAIAVPVLLLRMRSAA